MIPPSDIIQLPEGKTLEFKRDLSSPKQILKAIVAFANTAGGQIIIGVLDGSRAVVGIADPLDEEERLCSLIADTIAPRLVPDIELFSIGEKTLLGVTVYPSGRRPHFIRSEGPDQGVYVRLGSTNRQADRELIEELHRSCSGVSFDELPVVDQLINDLDIEAAKKSFLGIRELNREELQTLKLIVPMQGREVLTNGAILLFGRKREYSFPDAWIQCGRFRGTDKADIFDHIDIRDHFPDAVESVMLFLKKHAFRGADFSAIRRKDVWSIPLTILREVLINAIVHADYSQKGAPIRVSFFDDRIEIENPGILLPGMTIEDVKQGISKIRNRVIARIFREIGLIEQWGSGFRRILCDAEELGLPEPVMVEVGMRVRVTVFIHQHGEGYHVSDRICAGSPVRSVTQSATRSTDPVERLLPLLADGEKSSKELRSGLSMTHRHNFRENYIHPALEAGFIEMTIPEKPSSRLQQYRLTDKGKAHLSGAMKTENLR